MMFTNNLMGMWMFGILVMVILAYLVSLDANSVGENGSLWFLVVLLFPMMGLVFYIIFRVAYKNSTGYVSPNNKPRVINSPNTTPVYREFQNHWTKVESQNNNLMDQGSKHSEYCTNCGYQNEVKASFCRKCGTKLH